MVADGRWQNNVNNYSLWAKYLPLVIIILDIYLQELKRAQDGGHERQCEPFYNLCEVSMGVVSNGLWHSAAANSSKVIWCLPSAQASVPLWEFHYFFFNSWVHMQNLGNRLLRCSLFNNDTQFTISLRLLRSYTEAGCAATEELLLYFQQVFGNRLNQRPNITTLCVVLAHELRVLVHQRTTKKILTSSECLNPRSRGRARKLKLQSILGALREQSCKANRLTWA